MASRPKSAINLATSSTATSEAETEGIHKRFKPLRAIRRMFGDGKKTRKKADASKCEVSEALSDEESVRMRHKGRQNDLNRPMSMSVDNIFSEFGDDEKHRSLPKPIPGDGRASYDDDSHQTPQAASNARYGVRSMHIENPSRYISTSAPPATSKGKTPRTPETKDKHGATKENKQKIKAAKKKKKKGIKGNKSKGDMKLEMADDTPEVPLSNTAAHDRIAARPKNRRARTRPSRLAETSIKNEFDIVSSDFPKYDEVKAPEKTEEPSKEVTTNILDIPMVEEEEEKTDVKQEKELPVAENNDTTKRDEPVKKSQSFKSPFGAAIIPTMDDVAKVKLRKTSSSASQDLTNSLEPTSKYKDNSGISPKLSHKIAKDGKSKGDTPGKKDKDSKKFSIVSEKGNEFPKPGKSSKADAGKKEKDKKASKSNIKEEASPKSKGDPPKKKISKGKLKEEESATSEAEKKAPKEKKAWFSKSKEESKSSKKDASSRAAQSKHKSEPADFSETSKELLTPVEGLPLNEYSDNLNEQLLKKVEAVGIKSNNDLYEQKSQSDTRPAPPNDKDKPKKVPLMPPTKKIVSTVSKEEKEKKRSSKILDLTAQMLVQPQSNIEKTDEETDVKKDKPDSSVDASEARENLFGKLRKVNRSSSDKETDKNKTDKVESEDNSSKENPFLKLQKVNRSKSDSCRHGKISDATSSSPDAPSTPETDSLEDGFVKLRKVSRSSSDKEEKMKGKSDATSAISMENPFGKLKKVKQSNPNEEKEENTSPNFSHSADIKETTIPVAEIRECTGLESSESQKNTLTPPLTNSPKNPKKSVKKQTGNSKNTSPFPVKLRSTGKIDKLCKTEKSSDILPNGTKLETNTNEKNASNKSTAIESHNDNNNNSTALKDTITGNSTMSNLFNSNSSTKKSSKLECGGVSKTMSKIADISTSSCDPKEMNVENSKRFDNKYAEKSLSLDAKDQSSQPSWLKLARKHSKKWESSMTTKQNLDSVPVEITKSAEPKSQLSVPATTSPMQNLEREVLSFPVVDHSSKKQQHDGKDKSINRKNNNLSISSRSKSMRERNKLEKPPKLVKRAISDTIPIPKPKQGLQERQWSSFKDSHDPNYSPNGDAPQWVAIAIQKHDNFRVEETV
ncbi:unnamed protein product [Clavelina lepadiformis]|uniref:Uncharacterized protein n=2 Tax=Clavelina lepadiformis TaxID=159417 RepID=A0ABP0FY06_CLALP